MPLAFPFPRPRRWTTWARLAGLGLAGVGILGLAGVSQPRTGLGRTLMGLGLPGAAAAILDDPAWRGPALYQAGRYDEAAAKLAWELRRVCLELGVIIHEHTQITDISDEGDTVVLSAATGRVHARRVALGTASTRTPQARQSTRRMQ